MSRAPFLLPNARQGYKFGNQTMVDAVRMTACGARSKTGRWAKRRNTSPKKCDVSLPSQDRFSGAKSPARGERRGPAGAFNG